MTEPELKRYIGQVINGLDDAKPSDALSTIAVVATMIFRQLPPERRGGVADSWFELILSGIES